MIDTGTCFTITGAYQKLYLISLHWGRYANKQEPDKPDFYTKNLCWCFKDRILHLQFKAFGIKKAPATAGAFKNRSVLS